MSYQKKQDKEDSRGFTLHLQRLVYAQELTKTFLAQIYYKVSSMTLE